MTQKSDDKKRDQVLAQMLKTPPKQQKPEKTGKKNK